jgi:hypothetical protein
MGRLASDGGVMPLAPALGARKCGDLLNIEVDLMARYAARLAEARQRSKSDAWFPRQGAGGDGCERTAIGADMHSPKSASVALL